MHTASPQAQRQTGIAAALSAREHRSAPGSCGLRSSRAGQRHLLGDVCDGRVHRTSHDDPVQPGAGGTVPAVHLVLESSSIAEEMTVTTSNKVGPPLPVVLDEVTTALTRLSEALRREYERSRRPAGRCPVPHGHRPLPERRRDRAGGAGDGRGGAGTLARVRHRGSHGRDGELPVRAADGGQRALRRDQRLLPAGTRLPGPRRSPAGCTPPLWKRPCAATACTCGRSSSPSSCAPR